MQYGGSERIPSPEQKIRKLSYLSLDVFSLGWRKGHRHFLILLQMTDSYHELKMLAEGLILLNFECKKNIQLVVLIDKLRKYKEYGREVDLDLNISLKRLN
jgi:hypothetical protein